MCMAWSFSVHGNIAVMLVCMSELHVARIA